MVGDLTALHFVERIGPRGNRLRLERLHLERRRHLGAQHAEQVVAHRHLLHRAAVQHAQNGGLVVIGNALRGVLRVCAAVLPALRSPRHRPCQRP